MERRNNRVTAAVWQFDSGAIGSLTHSTVLHTSHYETGDLHACTDRDAEHVMTD